MDSRKKPMIVKRTKNKYHSRQSAAPTVDKGDDSIAFLIKEFGGYEVDSDGNRLPPKGLV